MNCNDLKLKLWNIDKKEMVDKKVYMILNAIQEGLIDVESFSLVRCTGKNDVNNDDIYEGDILSHCFMDAYPDKKGIVEFVDGCWLIRAENTKQYRPLCDIDCWASFESYPYSLEVIGNVFQDAELLNETRNVY